MLFFSFFDAVNNDYHLRYNDSEAKNKGTDLSGLFSGDIDNQLRGAFTLNTWDIGADEALSYDEVASYGNEIKNDRGDETNSILNGISLSLLSR